MKREGSSLAARQMKRHVSLAGLVLVILVGCSDHQSDAEPPPKEPAAQELMERHREITEEGILAGFVSAISASRHERAFGMLHPDLAKAWTQERFAQDWMDIKAQLAAGWQPEAVGSFSGQSPQGPYEQASYRLDSDWRSVSSVELTAMQSEGQPKIVLVQVRIPHADGPPNEVDARITEFVKRMVAGEYEPVVAMMSPTCKAQSPPQLLQQVSPVLGGSVDATSRDHYRICANGTWYHAVRLTPTDDPVTFLEVIVSVAEGSVQIEGLAFKGRVRM